MFKHILKFVRPKIIVTCTTIALIGALSSGKLSLEILLVLPILIAWYIHAASANDYVDREIDAINIPRAKYRPFMNDQLSARELWAAHAFAGLVCLLLTAYFGPQAVVLMCGILLLDYVYSFKPVYIAGRGVLAQLMLPLAYVLFPFTLGYWSTGANSSYSWPLMLGLYLGFSARLFLKDFRDTKGDAAFGKRTFLLRHGVKQTCLMSGLFALISTCIVVFAVGFSPGIVTVVLFNNCIAIYLLAQLAKGQHEQQLTTIATLAKIGNASAISLLTYFAVTRYIGEHSAWAIVAPLAVGAIIAVNIGKSSGLTLKFNSPSFFQHLIWLPVRSFMHLCCSVKIRGLEHVSGVPSHAIIASNHVTELDPLLIVSSLPFFSKQLPIIYVVREKSYYAQHWKGIRKVFYGGRFFELIGGYEAFRGLNNYEKALANHLHAAKQGRSVCIFPVGRWHTDKEYSQARGGVAFLAASTNLPIIPVHIGGIDAKTTLQDYLHRKPKMVITFGKPLYAKDIFETPLNKLRVDDRQAYKAAAVKLMKKISSL